MLKRMGTRLIVGALMLVGAEAVPAQQDALLAPTPPMGWSTWNHYGHNISDKLLRDQADAMVSSGMRDAGYLYVHIDGGWEGQRDSSGRLNPSPAFPDMKALGDYIHSKGLKFGLYSGPGPMTCAGAEASYGHEEQDAQMFADWGVDYLKYDLCSFRLIMQRDGGGDVRKGYDLMRAAYDRMHQAIQKTGRPMLFSLCQYGDDAVWEWGASVGGDMWRTTDDISDGWDRMIGIANEQAGLAKYAGHGRWNDPDFLEVGNRGMTFEEQKTHFSLWALLAAPLMAGNDMTDMSAETKSILLNREVIAIDQDKLGQGGDRVISHGPLQVWTRPLAGGGMAVLMLNETNAAETMTVKLREIGWTGEAKGRDVWAHKDIDLGSGSYTATVPKHGVAMLRLNSR